MSILISVVVPAYNEEKLIGLSLESLKNQDFGRQNYEVTVVDNKSTDKTPQLLKRSFVKQVEETKKGVSFAVKKGFLHASGQIVATADADTIVNQAGFQIFIKLLKTIQKHP